MEWFCPDCFTWTECPDGDGCCSVCGNKLVEAKDGTEYMKEPWESPEILHPGVDDPDKVPMLRATYPHATTWEMCGYCGVEVVIPAYQESTCPVCGQPIIPCSMCAVLKDDGYWHMTCHDKCPYSKEVE